MSKKKTKKKAKKKDICSRERGIWSRGLLNPTGRAKVVRQAFSEGVVGGKEIW